MIDVFKLRKGMTRREVESLFGQPTDVSVGSRSERKRFLKSSFYRYGTIQIGFDRSGGRMGDEDQLIWAFDNGDCGTKHDPVICFANL